MSLEAIEREELLEMSMVEIAFEIMKESKKPFDYYDLVKQVAAVKQMSEEQLNERIAYLYTDMNIDGRFHSLGDNRWGLKSWYPLEQSEEEITTPVKPKKKAKADLDDVDTLDDDFEDYEDEYEDLEDELDELSNDEDDEDDDEFEDKEEIDVLDADETEDDLDEDDDLK